jgi:hypothetical protein
VLIDRNWLELYWIRRSNLHVGLGEVICTVELLVDPKDCEEILLAEVEFNFETNQWEVTIGFYYYEEDAICEEIADYYVRYFLDVYGKFLKKENRELIS